MVCLFFSMLSVSIAEDPMEKALELMRRKLHDQAIPILVQMVIDNPTNSRARFQLGICFLSQENYQRAYEAFSTAVELKSDHRFLAGERYREAGMEKLNLGQVAKVDHLFRKAIEFQPHLAPRIADACQTRAVEFLKKKDFGRAATLFSLATEFEPGNKPSVLKILIESGNAADDEMCLGYYNLASEFCGVECPEGQKAGIRLKTIADRLENADVLDPKINLYREIGRKFIYIPRNVEICEPGKHVYNLNPGEITPWLGFPPGIRISFEIQASSNKLEVVLGDGSVVRYWKSEKLPEIDKLPNAQIKFRALDETVLVNLIVSEIE